MVGEHVTDELLQRHFDGELDGNEQAEARKHLAECTSCSARLRKLDRLQSLVRMAAQDAALEANFKDMYARIERATATPERAATRKPLTHTRWFRPATMSAAGVLAAAAAVLLMIYRQDGGESGGGETLPADSTGPLAVLDVPRSSEIVQVDFGANAGTVFDIAFADGSSTPVVWINDEDLEE